jgi:hypothetical protein
LQDQAKLRFRLAFSNKTSDAAARPEFDAIETKAPCNSWPTGEQQVGAASQQNVPEKDLRDKIKLNRCERTEGHLFGHFGSDNFGNEGTLQAIHFNLLRVTPANCTGGMRLFRRSKARTR